VAENADLPEGSPRLHLVLVPGFVGFDALGQLDYYAGVTEVFDRWNGPAGKTSRDVSIHYFDNYPTASVKLRSTRLRQYLAQRVARGEFAPGDSLALVGHSTGGLDIRRAIFDMAADEEASLVVDGCFEVTHGQILAMTKRIAFLSVPQFGTNLADFATRFSSTIQALAGDGVLGLQLNQGLLGTLRRQVFAGLASSPSNLVLALVDTLDESDENPKADEEQQAAQREARFELTSWLDNMAHDFSIIADLRSQTAAQAAEGPETPSRPKSPAHFNAGERQKELAAWAKHGIKTHTYATRVPPGSVPESVVARKAVKAMHTASPVIDGVAKVVRWTRWVLPPVTIAVWATRASEIFSVPVFLEVLARSPSLVFDLFHAACADPEGPFRDPDTYAPQSLVPTFRHLGSDAEVSRTEVGVGDSDGVVNTLSQLWPYDPAQPGAHPVDLVDADHGDVIGHFDLKALKKPDPGGRHYYAYDFFQTDLKFTQAKFERLWNSVFDFCVCA
jgi:hypothetical protein